MAKILDINEKAWIKYDASGRVVPGLLLIRKKKPSGRGWVEVPVYLCCGPTTTTTTTTTTV